VLHKILLPKYFMLKSRLAVDGREPEPLDSLSGTYVKPNEPKIIGETRQKGTGGEN